MSPVSVVASPVGFYCGPVPGAPYISDCKRSQQRLLFIIIVAISAWGSLLSALSFGAGAFCSLSSEAPDFMHVIAQLSSVASEGLPLISAVYKTHTALWLLSRITNLIRRISKLVVASGHSERSCE